jgi:hypothetical protein
MVRLVVVCKGNPPYEVRDPTSINLIVLATVKAPKETNRCQAASAIFFRRMVPFAGK